MVKPLDALELLEIDKAIKLLKDKQVSVDSYTTIKTVVTLPPRIFLQMFSEYEMLKPGTKYMYVLKTISDNVEYKAYLAEFEFEKYGLKTEARNEAVRY